MTLTDARRRVGAQIDRTENSESPFQRAALPDTAFRESHALREHSFIQNAENQLDGFLAQGREVLDNLVDQKNILRGTQRRVAEAAGTIGLSRDVIGWIERRSTQDTYIFIAGDNLHLLLLLFNLALLWVDLAGVQSPGVRMYILHSNCIIPHTITAAHSLSSPGLLHVWPFTAS